MNILGLTLHEPWSSLVALGHKPIENRRWAPPKYFLERGGWIAIHAGKTYDPLATGWIRDRFPDLAIPRSSSTGIIAVARVVGWLEPVTGEMRLHDQSAAPPSDADRRWHMADQYGWILRDLVRLREPVPCRGYQKLWPLREVYAPVREAYAAARRSA